MKGMRDLDPLTRSTLELAQQWCRIPSVKGNVAALLRQASEIATWLRQELGAEIVLGEEGIAPPLLHARLDLGKRDTVILYNMYDVMPASSRGWMVDPFEGGIVDIDHVGRAFVARGAENNKGPLAGMLWAVKDMLERRKLGVNVEFLIEGEEESGSRGLRAYLEDPACPVRRSAAALFPSFCEYGGGPPRLYLGFSGIAKGEIRTKGGEWGGPLAPIHSSNAPWIGNPAARLVEALSRLGKPPTGRLAAIDIDEPARALLVELASLFDPVAELTFRKAQRYALDGDACVLLEHVLSTASLNIARLATVPADGDAVIPSAASARFDLRCPPGLNPSALLDEMRLCIADLAGVEVAVFDCYPGQRFAADALGVAALEHAYALDARPIQIWPWAIGAAPAYAFARRAGSFLIGGLGRGGNAHGVDEYLTLDGLSRFTASIERWLGAMTTGIRTPRSISDKESKQA